MSLIGRTLSHYRILEPLGAGGMGEVYRARDERLERDVAVKVLPAGALADESARKQFRKEALALSKLNHPNIAVIHDFDTQDGVDFLVMELVEGETLAERLQRGSLPEREILRLGTQLAEGLAAAHEEGVLHRDIKPSNLRITSKGSLKILDFGLAKRIVAPGGIGTTESMTELGSVAGTVPYMAPEQLRGERLDERADIWATGAVLYEMATGARPFPQEPVTRVIGAILHEPSEPPRVAGAGIGPDLERAILRCLEKDPAARPGSARELGADLRRLAGGEALAPRRAGTGRGAGRAVAGAGPGSRRARNAAIIGGSAGALLAAAVILFIANVGGLRDRFSSGSSSAPGASLAVLPLVNLSGDPAQEFFADGMTDELISRLAQVGSMRVISRTSSMQYKGAKKSIREIAKELGVRMIVEGSVLRAGPAVRITAQLIDAVADRPLWSESFQREAGDVLRLQSDVAQAIVGRVAVKISPEVQGRLAAAPRVSPEAHEAYLRGRQYYNSFSIEGFDKSIEQFNRAIEIDPQYAPAYAGLADAYCALSSIHIPANDAMPRARAAAKKALELDPDLAAGHVSLAYVQAFYDWDWAGAERTFRRALDLNPGEATAHQFYAQMLMSRGRYAEANAELRLAREIDPLSPFIAGMSIWPVYLERRFKDAAAEARKLLAVDPTNSIPHFCLGLSVSMLGDNQRGLAEFRRAYELDRRPNYLCWVGWAHARMGNRRGALGVLDSLRTLSREGEYVQPYTMAVIFAAVGEKDSAFACLERGIELRSEEMTIEILNGVAMDPLRGDPRFAAILERMGFPPPSATTEAPGRRSGASRN